MQGPGRWLDDAGCKQGVAYVGGITAGVAVPDGSDAALTQCQRLGRAGVDGAGQAQFGAALHRARCTRRLVVELVA